MKALIRELCPPALWRAMSRARSALFPPQAAGHPGGQDLDVYWDEEMAQVLETWGEGNAWSEIQFLMANCHGRVLDIACGTGKVMSILGDTPGLELHGCDISDMLIGKARGRGIAQDRLRVCDATQLPYPDKSFDFSYSIGSLEHFTQEGIDQAIAEMARVTRLGSFHMMPTSRSGRDEGWLKTYQSFHNCSPGWWAPRFARNFRSVRVLASRWEDRISVGSWFLCWH
jgi:ubiquinone/menaquinone biosynthesis C-methylase UbiE